MSEGFLPYIPSINLDEMPKIEYNNTTITTSLMSFVFRFKIDGNFSKIIKI